MTVPRLGGLIDRDGLASLLAASASLLPGHRIRILDEDGSVVVATPETTPVRGATTTRVVRPIAVVDARFGSVEVDGPDPAAGAMAELLARAIALAGMSETRGSAGAAIARAAIDAELAIGRRIQLSLMPRRFPVVPGWEIASAYEPAREVGGDFYDAFAVRGEAGRLGLVVADVTGKGVPAALLMADTRALIRAAVDHGSGPANALGRVNRILVGERASGLFVTVALGMLDAASGSLTFASAGHDPVHVLRWNGSLTILEPSGRLLGMVADIAATSRTVELLPGDAFVGHTDGVTEARALDGSFYGEERFRSLLARLASGSAAEIVEAIVRDVRAFRDGADPSDDLTLLVVRRQPAGP